MNLFSKLSISKSGIFIFFTVLFGFLIRILFLTFIEHRLAIDELSIGYNAYSILQTGRDEWGRFLPIAFQAFGDWKLPGYIYATVPFIQIFGLNELSVLFPSIIAGTLLIYLVYKIGKEIYPQSLVGEAASIVIAISPWTIHLSRRAMETNLGLCIFSAGILFLLKSLNKKKTPWIYVILSGIFFVLSAYTYIAYRLISFIFLFGLLMYFLIKKESLNLKTVLFNNIIFLIFLIPILLPTFSGSGTARLKQTSLLNDKGMVASINENRSFCYLIDSTKYTKLCAFSFNKVESIFSKVSKNYLSFISPSFIFLGGEMQSEYNKVPKYELIFWPFLPTYLLGLFLLLRNKSNFYKILLFLLLIGPIPTMINSGPQATRGTAMILPVTLITGLGINYIYEKYGKIGKLYLLMISSILTLYLISFLTFYYLVYPTNWDYSGYPITKQVANDIKQIKGNYDVVYNKGRTHFAYFAFHEQLDPEIIQTTAKRTEPNQFGWTYVIKYEKHEEGNLNAIDLLCNDQRKVLYLSSSLEDKNKLSGINKYTREYKNFANVHVQANLVDLEGYKQYLLDKQEYEYVCNQINPH